MFLADYNRAINPEITISAGHITKVEDAVGFWAGTQSPLGLNKISGTATIDFVDRKETRPFSFNYMVLAPGISATLDNANICYTGVNNPITVSVPGYDGDQLNLRVKGARVTKHTPGRFSIYFYEIPKEKTYVFVHATNNEGSTSTLGSLLLNIKELPPPIAAIDDITSGDITLQQLKNAKGLSLLRNDDFRMDYSIVSYRISLLRNGNREYIEPVEGTGKYFADNPQVTELLNTASHGDRIFIEDIVVKDSRRKPVPLAPVILRIH